MVSGGSNFLRPLVSFCRLPYVEFLEIIRSKIDILYGFSTLEVPAQMSEGLESGVWYFKTSKGDWVIKVYPPHQGQFERVKDEVVLYEHLNHGGIHVPEVLPSKRARRVEKLEIDRYGYPVIVMKLEDLRFTRPISIQKEELVRIAQTVARMHQCLKHYQPQDSLIERTYGCQEQHGETYNKLIGFPIRGALARVKKLARTLQKIDLKFRNHFSHVSFVTKDQPDGYAAQIGSSFACLFTAEELVAIRVLNQQVKAYLNAHFLTSRLTNAITHGDLSLKHTPFLPNGDVYFFDFADRALSPVAEELGGMLYRLYVEDEITFDRWEELKNWLLTGYTSASYLSSQDLSAISAFVMRRILRGIAYLYFISREICKEVDRKGIQKRYELAAYLLQQ